MPLYDYRCRQCGHFEPDQFAHASESEIDCPKCAGTMYRLLSAPAVKAPMQPYVSPASNKMISTEAQRRDDLKRTGCIEYDPEMRKDAVRKAEYRQKEIDATIDVAVEKAASELGITV